jgi:hypothetical protein
MYEEPILKRTALLSPIIVIYLPQQPLLIDSADIKKMQREGERYFL